MFGDDVPRYRVREAYEAAYPDPLTGRAGESWTFERRKSEWSGWIWCTNASGKSGWVPEAWVTVDGDRCALSRDYSARELTVRESEMLTTDIEVSGWGWCRNERGDEGWVPLDYLAPM